MGQNFNLYYFIGCSSFVNKETAENMLKILKSINQNVKLFDNEPCCGGYLYFQGYKDKAIEKFRKNIEYFSQYDIDQILVNCPECCYTLKYLYKKYFNNWDKVIIHSSELLYNLIKENKIQLNNVDLKVTYYDPCHLSRHCFIYDKPRFIIKKIPGLKFKELDLKIEHSQCCGGPIRDPFVEVRNELSLDILKLSRRKGKIIITACPTCKYNLNTVAELFEQKTKSIDIIDLVAYSMGLISDLNI